MIPFLVYKDVVYLCFSIVCVCVGPKFSLLFRKFVLRHVNLFSIVNSVRCCPFLFDELCRLNLWFPFFPVWAFMSPPMTRTLCFGMLRTKKNLEHQKKKKKKKKKKERERKEERKKSQITDLMKQHRKKVGSAISLALCLCVYVVITGILNTYQKSWLTLVKRSIFYCCDPILCQQGHSDCSRSFSFGSLSSTAWLLDCQLFDSKS